MKSIKLKPDEITSIDIENLLQLVFEDAEGCSEDYKANKSDFNTGLAQAYTEILEIFDDWMKITGLEATNLDIHQWIKEHLI